MSVLLFMAGLFLVLGARTIAGFFLILAAIFG